MEDGKERVLRGVFEPFIKTMQINVSEFFRVHTPIAIAELYKLTRSIYERDQDLRMFKIEFSQDIVLAMRRAKSHPEILPLIWTYFGNVINRWKPEVVLQGVSMMTERRAKARRLFRFSPKKR